MTQIIVPIPNGESSTRGTRPNYRPLPVLAIAGLLHCGTASVIIPETPVVPQTTFGSSPGEPTTQNAGALRDNGKLLAELRRVSGLTWDQLAQVFRVSRRSVHFWTSGKSMSAENELHLTEVLRALHAVDRGNAVVNRIALLEEFDGMTPVEFLSEKKYDLVVQRLGRGGGRSPTTEGLRIPPSPFEPGVLVAARQDRIHEEVSRTRPARIEKKTRNDQ